MKRRDLIGIWPKAENHCKGHVVEGPDQAGDDDGYRHTAVKGLWGRRFGGDRAWGPIERTEQQHAGRDQDRNSQKDRAPAMSYPDWREQQ